MSSDEHKNLIASSDKSDKCSNNNKEDINNNIQNGIFDCPINKIVFILVQCIIPFLTIEAPSGFNT